MPNEVHCTPWARKLSPFHPRPRSKALALWRLISRVPTHGRDYSTGGSPRDAIDAARAPAVPADDGDADAGLADASSSVMKSSLAICSGTALLIGASKNPHDDDFHDVSSSCIPHILLRELVQTGRARLRHPATRGRLCPPTCKAHGPTDGILGFLYDWCPAEVFQWVLCHV